MTRARGPAPVAWLCAIACRGATGDSDDTGGNACPIVVSDAETWSGEHHVDCDVYVTGRLDIAAGTSATFAPDAGIVVRDGGSLDIAGTEESPVTLSALGEPWGGVEFDASAAPGGARIAHARIEGVGTSTALRASGIDVDVDTVELPAGDAPGFDLTGAGFTAGSGALVFGFSGADYAEFGRIDAEYAGTMPACLPSAADGAFPDGSHVTVRPGSVTAPDAVWRACDWSVPYAVTGGDVDVIGSLRLEAPLWLEDGTLDVHGHLAIPGSDEAPDFWIKGGAFPNVRVNTGATATLSVTNIDTMHVSGGEVTTTEYPVAIHYELEVSDGGRFTPESIGLLSFEETRVDAVTLGTLPTDAWSYYAWINVPGGVVDSDTTWRSPGLGRASIQLEGPIIVSDSATLTIVGEIEVDLVDVGAAIYVGTTSPGALVVDGTADPVSVRCSTGATGIGLFDQTLDAATVIDGLITLDCGAAPLWGAIHLDAASPTIRNSTIYDSPTYGIWLANGAAPVIENVQFYDNALGDIGP